MTIFISTRGGGAQTSASTTHTVTFASAPTSGQLLVVVFRRDGDSTGPAITPPSGWTQIAGNFWDEFDAFVYAKVAGSSEPSSFAWTTASATTSSHRRFVVSDWTGTLPNGFRIGVTQHASTTNPDPPLVQLRDSGTPAEGTLFVVIAVAVWDGSTATATGYPSGYNNTGTHTAADARIASAEFPTEEFTLYENINPSTFTISASARSLGITIIIHNFPAEEEAAEGSGNVSAIGVISGVGTTTRSGSGTITAVGSLVGVGAKVSNGSGVISANAVLTGVGVKPSGGTGSISAVGVVSGVGLKTSSGFGSINATGPLIGVGLKLPEGVGSLTATGILIGVGADFRGGSGSVTSTGVLVGVGSKVSQGSGLVTGTGVLTGVGSKVSEGSGSISATGIASGVGLSPRNGSGTISASATLTGAGSKPSGGSGSLTSTATLVGQGSTDRNGTGTISAIGTLVGSGSSQAGGAGNVLSTATLVGVGTTARSGSGTIQAVGTFTGTGSSPRGGSGSISAVSSFTAIGSNSDGGGSGNITATSALLAEGATTRSGTGSITGTATFTGAGFSETGGSGSVDGYGAFTGSSEPPATRRGPKHCCCDVECELGSDDFNRPDSASPGPLWKLISGTGAIVDNHIEVDGVVVTRICHPSYAIHGSFIARFDLVNLRTVSIFEVGVGDPPGSAYKVEFEPKDMDTPSAKITVTVTGITIDTFDYPWPNDSGGNSVNTISASVCYEPGALLRGSIGIPPPIDVCISPGGDNCYSHGGDPVGGFFFKKGHFDNWSYEMTILDDFDCPPCGCFCFRRAGASKEFSCFPETLCLNFEVVEGTCPELDGKVITLYQGQASPADGFPEKVRWYSEVEECNSNEYTFILECTPIVQDGTNWLYAPSLRMASGNYITATTLFNWVDPTTPGGMTRLADYAQTTCEPLNIVYPGLRVNSFFGSCGPPYPPGVNGHRLFCCPSGECTPSPVVLELDLTVTECADAAPAMPYWLGPDDGGFDTQNFLSDLGI
jgi:hypothetical protein